MSILIHIGFGCIISLFSTMPIGSINMTVADTAIRKNQKAAMWVGFGGALVQIIQAALSLKFSTLLNNDPEVNKTFILVSIPILIGLGLYFYFKKPTEISPNKNVTENAKGFAKGVLISSLNMVNVPFFIFLGGYLGPSKWFHLDNLHIMMFALGTAIGSFIVFMAYAKFGVWIKKKYKSQSDKAGAIVAVLLFGIAIWQIIRYMMMD